MTDYADKKILVRTRSGKKIHSGYGGSSVTNCGHWLRVNGSTMQFPLAPVVKSLEAGEVKVANPSSLGPATLILCEHCFPTPMARTAPVVSAHYGDEPPTAAVWERLALDCESRIQAAPTQDEREGWQRAAASYWQRAS